MGGVEVPVAAEVEVRAEECKRMKGGGVVGGRAGVVYGRRAVEI